MMKRIFLIAVVIFLSHTLLAGPGEEALKFYAADNQGICYTGRIDFTNPARPRFWQPGVYITARFEGATCRIILYDEELWGKNHNYLEVVVDGRATRLQTKSKCDTITVAADLSPGGHDLLICKNTEANIGYLEFGGLFCSRLLMPTPLPERRIEFVGNSITCGASSDTSEIPCGKGVWQDQHNAYFSYGPVAARALNAQYHLSAVSGIGLMHSCCGMDIIMPAVYDKISMRDNKIEWDFKKYQPDVVTICLGQNDGIQDSTAFCDNYIAFLRTILRRYPKAIVFCLTSPMADATLSAFQKAMLSGIMSKIKSLGGSRVFFYFFSRQYSSGCDYHPDLTEHQSIASELAAFIRKKMKW